MRLSIRAGTQGNLPGGLDTAAKQRALQRTSHSNEERTRPTRGASQAEATGPGELPDGYSRETATSRLGSPRYSPSLPAVPIDTSASPERTMYQYRNTPGIAIAVVSR